jgi:hypothetical protein
MISLQRDGIPPSLYLQLKQEIQYIFLFYKQYIHYIESTKKYLLKPKLLECFKNNFGLKLDELFFN